MNLAWGWSILKQREPPKGPPTPLSKLGLDHIIHGIQMNLMKHCQDEEKYQVTIMS